MTWAETLNELERNSRGEGGPMPGNTAWDYVTFAGEVCPGVAHVRAKAGSSIDFQKPKGQKKTFAVDEGDPPVEFEITLFLQPGDLEEFRDFILPILRPASKSGGRDPLAFGHPMAEFWGVNDIIVGDIDTPHPESGGLMKVRIEAHEWTDAPVTVKTSGKVQESSGGTETVEGADPFDVSASDFLRNGL